MPILSESNQQQLRDRFQRDLLELGGLLGPTAPLDDHHQGAQQTAGHDLGESPKEELSNQRFSPSREDVVVCSQPIGLGDPPEDPHLQPRLSNTNKTHYATPHTHPL